MQIVLDKICKACDDLEVEFAEVAKSLTSGDLFLRKLLRLLLQQVIVAEV